MRSIHLLTNSGSGDLSKLGEDQDKEHIQMVRKERKGNGNLGRR